MQELGAVTCALCAGKNVLEGAWQDADVESQDCAKMVAGRLQQQDNGGTLEKRIDQNSTASAVCLPIGTLHASLFRLSSLLKVLDKLAAKHSTALSHAAKLSGRNAEGKVWNHRKAAHGHIQEAIIWSNGKSLWSCHGAQHQ